MVDAWDFPRAESSRLARLNPPLEELARQGAERMDHDAHFWQLDPATWACHAQEFLEDIDPALERHRRCQNQALMDEIERVVTERQAFKKVAPHKFVIGRGRSTPPDVFHFQAHYPCQGKPLLHL